MSTTQARSFLLVLLFSGVLLAGCAGGVRDDDGSGYRDLDGAVLVLEQAVQVPGGRARVYLQSPDGESPGQVTGGGFNSYRPHCALEIRSVDHAGWTIEPGEFQVTRVQRTIDMVVSRETPVRLAMFGLDGAQSYYDGFHFWLASEVQPDVMRLTCYGVYAAPYELFPPTLGEIALALGDVADLRY
jgi:hypothetical protein